MNVIVANKYQAMLSGLDIDVIKTMYGTYDVDEIIDTFSNFFFNRMILDITAINNYKDINNIRKLSVNLDMSKVILVLDDSPESASSTYLSQLISMGIYNFSRNLETVKYLMQNPNSYKDVAQIQQLQDLTTTIVNKVENDHTKVIGIKNITDHAGATTLIYMLKRQLEKSYRVLAIEVNKRDFSLFGDENMMSTNAAQLPNAFAKAADFDIVLVDLNDTDNDDACGDVLYLIEPSTIKLNRMIRRNRNIFTKLKGKKIVLNKSLLTSKDVLDFEYESKSQIFYNLPPLDDKKEELPELDNLLTKLNISRRGKNVVEDDSGKVLGLFKF